MGVVNNGLNYMHTANANMKKTRGSRAKAPPPQQSTTVSDTSLLLSEVRLLRQEVCDLKQQNTNIEIKLSDVSEVLHLKLDDFERKINAGAHLQHKLNISEQENMKSELEITGIPEEHNENLIHISMGTAKKISVQLSENDIDEVYRTGRCTNIMGKPGTIVLRLIRRAKRSNNQIC